MSEHCLMHEPSCVRVNGRWVRPTNTINIVLTREEWSLISACLSCADFREDEQEALQLKIDAALNQND